MCKIKYKEIPIERTEKRFRKGKVQRKFPVNTTRTEPAKKTSPHRENDKKWKLKKDEDHLNGTTVERREAPFISNLSK